MLIKQMVEQKSQKQTKNKSKEQKSERGVVQKIYDLMLYTTSSHPERERDKVHVLTRSAGRLPQAPTPGLGPCEYRGRGQGKERRWIQGGRLESSLVSTGFNWSGRKERGKIAK